MDAIFRKVYTRTFVDAKFLRLSSPPPCGKYLWLYLLTGPATSIIPGVLTTGEAALAEALGWPLKGFREAFAEALSEELVRADWKARLLWIPNGIKYNPPQSPNVIKSWRSAWDVVPECDLKREIYQHLKASVEGIGEAFAEAFSEITKSFAESGAGAGAGDKSRQQEQERPAGAGRARAAARPAFTPPTVDEVAAFCRERNNDIDARQFVDHYASKGWVVGKSPMRDWRAAVRTWERNGIERRRSGAGDGLLGGFREAAENAAADGSLHAEGR